MSTVTFYNNADTSAPVLSGQVGAMITLLDAVLVNGYGAKAAAGWTKAFTGTNLAAYRVNPSASGSSGMYLRVDDTNTQYAVIKAYKTMSDVNTGTDLLPSGTPSFTNSAIYWHKSGTANSTARPWAIVADDHTLYLNVANSGTIPATIGAYGHIYGAGDFKSFVPSNSYNYFILGAQTTSYVDQSYQITNTQGSYVACLIGRDQTLTSGTQSKAWLTPFGGDISGSSAHTFLDSTYTNSRFFYPGLLVENTTQTNVSGQFRGVFGFAGRNDSTWISNFGKLPDDPSGPDMIQFVAGPTASAIYIRLGDW